MDFIFNELSLTAIPKNKHEASSWIGYFFENAIEISKRRNEIVSLNTTIAFNQILLTPEYSFSTWLFSLPNKEQSQAIISMLTKKPILQSYPYFYYKNKTACGLGLAYTNGVIAMSYPANSWEATLRVKKEYFDEFENVQTDFHMVANISKRNHVDVYFPKRIFEHHPKHDINRPNLNDGESTLLYRIPYEIKEVESLLASAKGGNKKSKKLFNFDSNKNLYIEFQQHHKEKYHGYHIEKDTRVPYHIRKKLKS